MSVFQNQRELKERHQEEHRLGLIPKFRATFYQQCYPPPETTPETFANFWTWISNYCYARTYTAVSVVSLNTFVLIYKAEVPENNYVSYKVANYAYKLLGSLTYTSDPLDELWIYLLINLAPRTNYFCEPVDDLVFQELRQTICINYLGIPLTLRQEFENFYN